jgi:hypothetical protein
MKNKNIWEKRKQKIIKGNLKLSKLDEMQK